MRLPDEILLSILGHLTTRDLAASTCVCRRWHRVGTDESLWRRLYGAAGWKSGPTDRPTCGWRVALQRVAAATVLVLYTGADRDGQILAHVTSLVVGAGSTMARVVHAICTAVGHGKAARRLSRFWTAAPSAVVGDGEASQWVALNDSLADVPLAALDAVLWKTPLKGVLRMSNSPMMRVICVRPMAWLVECVPAAHRKGIVKDIARTYGAVASGHHRQPLSARDNVARPFVHAVEHGTSRSGAWTDDATGTLLWQRQPYRGQWRCGRRQGAGVQFYSDGSRYAGDWRDGARHGIGRCDGPDGRSGYEGRWHRDRPQGRGRCWWPDGGMHDGLFAAGQPHGPGTFVARNGMRASGTWHHGVARSVCWLSPFGSLWPVSLGTMAS
jgi:hypothetical protein